MLQHRPLEQPVEHCCLCSEPTGRAGRADDSIFVELLVDWPSENPNSYAVTPAGSKIGPLCNKCHIRMKEEGLVEQ